MMIAYNTDRKVSFAGITFRITQRVNRVEPVHRSDKPRKGHLYKGEVDGLKPATRGGSD